MPSSLTPKEDQLYSLYCQSISTFEQFKVQVYEEFNIIHYLMMTLWPCRTSSDLMQDSSNHILSLIILARSNARWFLCTREQFAYSYARQLTGDILVRMCLLQGFSVGVLKNPPMGMQKSSYDSTGGFLCTPTQRTSYEHTGCRNNFAYPHAKPIYVYRNNFAYPCTNTLLYTYLEKPHGVWVRKIYPPLPKYMYIGGFLHNLTQEHSFLDRSKINFA